MADLTPIKIVVRDQIADVPTPGNLSEPTRIILDSQKTETDKWTNSVYIALSLIVKTINDLTTKVNAVTNATKGQKGEPGPKGDKGDKDDAGTGTGTTLTTDTRNPRITDTAASAGLEWLNTATGERWTAVNTSGLWFRTTGEPGWTSYDTPPASADAFDDEFTGESSFAGTAPTGWTTSVSSGSHMKSGGSLHVSAQVTPLRVNGFYKAFTPAAAWKFRMKCRYAGQTVTSRIGLFAQNSTNSKVISWGSYFLNQIGVTSRRWNNANTYNSQPAATTVNPPPYQLIRYVSSSGPTMDFTSGWFYLEIEKAAGNITGRWSSDGGITWNDLWTEATSSFIETSGSIDRIGVIFDDPAVAEIAFIRKIS